MNYLTNALSKSVGTIICNEAKNNVGRMAEVTFNDEKEPQYAIIACNQFSKDDERYFAVPVSIVFMNLEESGKLVLNTNQNDFLEAADIRFEDCPVIKENDYFPCIYEVLQYKAPAGPSRPKRLFSS